MTGDDGVGFREGLLLSPIQLLAYDISVFVIICSSPKSPCFKIWWLQIPWVIVSKSPNLFYNSNRGRVDWILFVINRIVSNIANFFYVIIGNSDKKFIVQFNLFKTKETAHEYSEQTGIVSKSLIVSLQSDQGIVHGIISGPFLTKEEAQSFVVAPGMPKNFWIRSAQTLQSRVI